MLEAGKFVGGKITNGVKLVGGKAKDFKKKADEIRDKVKERKKEFEEKNPNLMRKIKKAKTLGTSAYRKSMPIALGMMGMAMSYSTGSSGVMEAIGVGSGIKRGSEEMMSTSQGTLEGNVQDNLNEDVANDSKVQEVEEELEENAEEIKETNESLRTTNDSIENMSEEDQAKGNEYYQSLQEEEALKKREAELRAQSEHSEAELAELQKNIERQAEIEASKSEMDADPNMSGIAAVFAQKHQLEKQLAEQTGKRSELKVKAQETKKEAAKNIIGQYRDNGGAAQIAKAKSEITKAIQKYMLEQKYKDSQGDVSADYTLSDKETRSAERMQESIAALVDRAVVSGGGHLDTGQVFKRFFGEDSDSPMAESLKQAIDAYQFQSRSRNYNENEELYQGTGGYKEKFENDVSTKASKHG